MNTATTTAPDDLHLPVQAVATPWRGAHHASMALIIGIGVVSVLDAMILASLLTPIKAEFGFRDEQIGRLSACFTLAGVVGAPLFGALANRFGRKRVLLAGVVFWSIASFATGLAGSFAGLLLWRIATGFGEAAYNSTSPSWIADLYRPRWRNLAFSVFMVKNKVGTALALALGGWLAAAYGWRVAFFVAAVPGLVLAFALAFVREPVLGESEDGGVDPATTGPGLRESLGVFRYAGYRFHLAALLFFFTAMSVQMWIPAWLHRAFDVPNQQASSFLAQVLLYTLPAGLVGGWLSSVTLRRYRWGFPAFLGVTSVLAAASFAVAYTSADLLRAQVFIAVATFIFGFSAGTLTTLVVESVPARLRNSAAAFSAVLATGISGIVGPEVVGLLSDAWTLGVAVFVGPTCYFTGGLVWLAYATWLLRQPAGPAAASSAAPALAGGPLPPSGPDRAPRDAADPALRH